MDGGHEEGGVVGEDATSQIGSRVSKTLSLNPNARSYELGHN